MTRDELIAANRALVDEGDTVAILPGLQADHASLSLGQAGLQGGEDPVEHPLADRRDVLG